jgi:polar amino acid transport system substrate-binding protein
MRRSFVVLVLLGLFLGACAEDDDAGSNESAGGDSSPASTGCDLADPPVLEEGVLIVATDRPAFPPWFEGSPKEYSGFEGEVASEVADRLGLEIRWVVEPFNKSYAPGAKDYDFDINQISVTPEREQAVDFSDPYFIDNQGLLALKDNPITEATTIEELKDYQLGAQVGTTSLGFINETIQPDTDPKVFDTTNDVKSALESGQVDALITDVVTTVYLRDFEIDGSEVVGQFETGEPFGMLFEEGSPLVDCVNQVIAEMESDGTLESLQDEWLQDYLSVPTFE